MQPALEVQLQPNGENSSIGCVALCWQLYFPGALHSASTERRAFFVESREKTGANYLIVNGKRITVSHEVYQTICEENNRIRYIARRESRCAQENYSVCRGDCFTCPWHTKGTVRSDTEFDVEYSMTMADRCDVEKEVLSAVAMDKVYAKADELVHYGARILRLRCQENCSNREIARQIGQTRQVIDAKMKVMFKYFRNNMENFF